MHQQVPPVAPVVQRHYSGFEALEPDPLVAPGAEHQRLAVLDLHQGVGAQLRLLCVIECPVVVDVAVLVDLDEGGAAVRGRPAQDRSEVPGVRVHRARHEGRLAAERDRQGMERRVDRPVGGAPGDVPGQGGRRVLPLGEPIDSVVEEQDLDVDVAPNRVHQVIAAHAERVAVAGDDPDLQVRAHGFEPRSDRGRAAVDAMNAVGVEVVREAARTADPGDEHQVLGRNAEFGQHLLHLREDREIAAARTPADLLVGGEVARRELSRRRRHRVFPPGMGRLSARAHASISSIRSAISLTQKGRPRTFPSDTTSAR